MIWGESSDIRIIYLAVPLFQYEIGPTLGETSLQMPKLYSCGIWWSAGILMASDLFPPWNCNWCCFACSCIQCILWISKTCFDWISYGLPIFFYCFHIFPYSVHFISISETCGDNEETIQKTTTGSVFQQAVHEVHSTRFIPPWLQPPLH